DRLRRRAHRRGSHALRRRDSRAHERQPLPLWRLSEHPGRDSPGRARGRITMVPFAYAAAPSADAAIAYVARRRGVEFIAGGTDMLQLLQEGVRAPAELVDINRLPLDDVEVDADGVRIGATARMSDVADHPRIRAEYPA